MTGYGRAECQLDQASYLIEMKAVNSRNLDLKLRLAPELMPFELQLRKAVSSIVIRGKVDCTITRIDASTQAASLNIEQAEAYIVQLKQLAEKTGVELSSLLPSYLQLPGILGSADVKYSDEEIKQLEIACQEAAQNLMASRLHEGDSIAADLQSSIEAINTRMADIEPLESRRIALVRERLNKKLIELKLGDQIDQNRFEQELVFSLDKLDINEEKVRLRQHCAFFVEVLTSEASAKGKRLNFISQEMGREINTLGSKANDSEIQRHVVDMKTQLEQIKEQVLNVL